MTDYDDLCKRLRDMTSFLPNISPDAALLLEAADAIAALRDHVAQVVAMLAVAEAEREALREQVAAKDACHDRDLGRTIDERDAAEEAISQAYFLVIGTNPEWSNMFGHEDAIEQIGDAISTLKQVAIRAERAEADNAALRQLLASISQRIVKALYDDPVERKGIATVIDAALLAGKSP